MQQSPRPTTVGQYQRRLGLSSLKGWDRLREPVSSPARQSLLLIADEFNDDIGYGE